MTNLFYLVPAAAVVALLFAYIFFRQMMKESEGTVTMKQIAQVIGISPGNLDSSLCFFQPSISHDVLCI